MVEYHNNQATPTDPNSNSMATMFFVLLAIVLIVIAAMYLFPRIGQNLDDGGSTDTSNTRIQIDTPLDDGGTSGDTGGNTGDNTGSGDTDGTAQ